MGVSKPDWFKIKLPEGNNYSAVVSNLRQNRLNTICQQARCPNRSVCWSDGTATFLILGTRCTRHCGFCAVAKGRPGPPDPEEPRRVGEAVASLKIRHAVVTSVTRDDLDDGGASVFALTIEKIRQLAPSTQVEVLIPDFRGSKEALGVVLAAKPDVLGHNVEVPASLYPRLGREKANYRRSLGVIETAKKAGFITKSGLMVGLGETKEDLRETLLDLRSAGCDLLTIGQYLQPTIRQLPVTRYYLPEELADLKKEAEALGFLGVMAGPLVRSSYLAHQLYLRARGCVT